MAKFKNGYFTTSLTLAEQTWRQAQTLTKEIWHISLSAYMRSLIKRDYDKYQAELRARGQQ
jgi:hypothetical protein